MLSTADYSLSKHGVSGIARQHKLSNSLGNPRGRLFDKRAPVHHVEGREVVCAIESHSTQAAMLLRRSGKTE